MFDDPFFFQPQYFECKQADIEQVSKKYCFEKSRPGGGGGEGFIYLVFIYT